MAAHAFLGRLHSLGLTGRTALGYVRDGVIGAQAGLEAGAHWTIALLTGVMSAAFGGLIRDIIVNDVPLLLKEDVYALAALAGAAAYVAALALDIGPSFAAVGGAVIAFVLRGCAIQFKWSLPPIGKMG